MIKYLCHSANQDCWLMTYQNSLYLKETQIEKSSAISEEIRNQLKTDFKLNLSPEIKIQRREEEIETEREPIQF